MPTSRALLGVYTAFAACVNFRPPSFTETDTLLANMRAAGIVSAADAEGSDGSEGSDDNNTLVAAPRRRLTRAEYDAGYGDSNDFDDASDDEAQSSNLAECAPPSLAGYAQCAFAMAGMGTADRTGRLTVASRLVA